jgi:hypothetical protein
MRIIDIAKPDDPNFRTFYRLYETVFVLAEEREPLEGFQQTLSFNHRPAVQDAFGPFSEQIALALDPATGDAVGLINFILYAYPEAAAGPAAFAGSCQLNFICVDEKQRGKDVAGSLLAHLDDRMRGFVAAKAPAAPQRFFTHASRTIRPACRPISFGPTSTLH